MNNNTLAVKIQGNAERSYDIHVKSGFDDFISQWVISQSKKITKIFILSETKLKFVTIQPLLDALKTEQLQMEIEQIYFEGGEKNKSLGSLEPVYNALIEKGVDRNSLLIACGGGVVGDFAGFVAATILRGIRFIQIPTTLLAMVDSSVGGKVAVNAAMGKNMVGAFYQPELVYCNIDYLKTLPEREWVCGLAEMAKHAMLSERADIIQYLYNHASSIRSNEKLQRAVIDSVSVKANVVSQDEKETGLRATLNLGHTTAHAIESLTGYTRFLHGEAVSRGLVTALLLSYKTAGLNSEDLKKCLELIQSLNLPVDTAGLNAVDLLEHMKFDKKNEGGKIKFVLLEKIGRASFGHTLDSEQFIEAWKEQKERFG